MTKRQAQVLAFIRAYIAENSHSPSLEDIGAALGIKSRGAVHRLVHVLERDGKITVKPGRARSIELVAA